MPRKLSSRRSPEPIVERRGWVEEEEDEEEEPKRDADGAASDGNEVHGAVDAGPIAPLLLPSPTSSLAGRDDEE